MQKNNSFKITIYALSFNLFRLTLLIVSVFFCFSQFGCYKNANSPVTDAENTQNSQENRININVASAEELKKLPKIGEELANRIIEYREKNGKFSRAEHLILVRGMTDKKFREIKSLVKTE